MYLHYRARHKRFFAASALIFADFCEYIFLSIFDFMLHAQPQGIIMRPSLSHFSKVDIFTINLMYLWAPIGLYEARDISFSAVKVMIFSHFCERFQVYLFFALPNTRDQFYGLTRDTNQKLKLSQLI